MRKAMDSYCSTPGKRKTCVDAAGIVFVSPMPTTDEMAKLHSTGFVLSFIFLFLVSHMYFERAGLYRAGSHPRIFTSLEKLSCSANQSHRARTLEKQNSPSWCVRIAVRRHSIASHESYPRLGFSLALHVEKRVIHHVQHENTCNSFLPSRIIDRMVCQSTSVACSPYCLVRIAV